MNQHQVAPADLALQDAFQSATLPPAEFSHRTHLLLAYAFLAQHDVEDAADRIRTGLVDYLKARQIDPSKYHETLTRAWMLAVRHFMQRTPATRSGTEFIERNPVLLDSGIMLTHYTQQRLFSAEARAHFVEPDLDPIPQH